MYPRESSGLDSGIILDLEHLGGFNPSLPTSSTVAFGWDFGGAGGGLPASCPPCQLFPVPHLDLKDGLAGTSIHTWFCCAAVDAGPCPDTKGLKGGILSQLCTHTFLKSEFCVTSFGWVGKI